ncbi:MAG: type II toxin-antitoxin system VapC family toxin [Aggregatilineales bacterium]
MSQYIVDASIVVQLVTTETHSTHARELFRRIEEGYELIVPEFCLLECTNVLWKRVRFHDLDAKIASEYVKGLQGLEIIIVHTIDLLPRALEIGLKHKLAVYDSLYIALAENMKYPLITDDSKQAKAAALEGITLKPITDFSVADTDE